MAEQEELSRAEQLAKRALELSARAEELARQAHEVAGVDEQLAALEAELDSLAAEEAALDAGMDVAEPTGPGADPAAEAPADGHGAPGSDQTGPPHAPHDHDDADDEPGFGDWTDLAETFGQRLELLGDRISELVAMRIDNALHSDQGRRRGRWASRSGEEVLDVTGTPLVRVSTRGGRVNVRAGLPGRVHVQWNLHGPFASGDGGSPVSVSERDGAILVESAGRLGMRGVSLDVEIPAGSAVDASTGGGPVDVAGTGGPVRAKTGGGSVKVADASGEVRVETGGGSIRFEGRPSGDSLLRTGGGAVDVQLAADTRVEVDAQGSMASIDVPGTQVRGARVTGTVGGGGEGRLAVRTGGGSVRVRQDI